MEYIKKWDNSDWIESALDNETAALVFCGFGKNDFDTKDDDQIGDDEDMETEEESESDDEESSAHIQILHEVITEAEIEDGREFSITVGGLLLKLINVTANLFKIFHKSPMKKTKTKTIKRFYPNQQQKKKNLRTRSNQKEKKNTVKRCSSTPQTLQAIFFLM